MALFVGGKSALEYWRAAGSREEAKPSKARPAAGSGPKAEEVRAVDFTSLGIDSDPIVLIVRDPGSRRSVNGIRCCVWRECVIPGSFVNACNGVYVSSPEACFVQMAGTLTCVQTVKLGMELCGSYALNPRGEGGFTPRNPITTVKRLKAYLDKTSKMRGAKRAKEALKHIVDGSASPAETNLFILLCFPVGSGGYGVPRPLLNSRMEIPRSAKPLSAKKYFRCDMFWPRIKTAIEYDSDAWHLDDGRRSDDAAKRNAIDAMGITVVTVTKGQLYDAREMDRIALILTRKFGRYHPSTCKRAMSKRYELRKAVLFENAGVELRGYSEALGVALADGDNKDA